MTSTATPTPRIPAPTPSINPENKPFWDATLNDELLIKRCDDCQEYHWYPRAICPFCGSFNTSWVKASGKGEIYSFAVTRRGQGQYKDATPFVLAYVQLDEGPRVMTNIVDCDPDHLKITDRVEVVFHRTDGDAALPRFRPAS